jgi:TonB family protein
MLRRFPYGRIELKQRHQQFMSAAFFISIFVHLFILILFLIFYKGETETEHVVTMRIIIPEMVPPPDFQEIKTLPKLSINNSKQKESADEPGENIFTFNESTKKGGNTTNNLDPKAGPSKRTSVGIPDKYNIPRKGASPDDKSISFPDNKIDAGDKKQPGKSGIPVVGKDNQFSMTGDKESKTIRIPGNKTGTEGMARSNSPGNKNIPGKDGSGIVGSGASNFSVSWNDGGSRSKTAGSLPRPPDNLSKSVQIKVAITVAPNGTVKKVTPLQKGDFNLENEAVKTIRTWKFEPLKSSVPQVDQSAVITFKFTLD